MKRLLPRLIVPCLCLCLLALTGRPAIAADEVFMQNGDRYVGTILSLTTNTLVLQSDILGKVQLQRAKVASITLNAPALLKEPPKNTTVATRFGSLPGGTNDMDALVLQLGRSTNVVSDVQKGLLSQATPETTRQFNDMLKGLLTGRLSVEDIRAQAATAAAQIREIRSELGDEAGGVLDGYLKILEDFVNKGPNRSTNSASRGPS